jgi:hypothetical protein
MKCSANILFLFGDTCTLQAILGDFFQALRICVDMAWGPHMASQVQAVMMIAVSGVLRFCMLLSVLW